MPRNVVYLCLWLVSALRQSRLVQGQFTGLADPSEQLTSTSLSASDLCWSIQNDCTVPYVSCVSSLCSACTTIGDSHINDCCQSTIGSLDCFYTDFEYVFSYYTLSTTRPPLSVSNDFFESHFSLTSGPSSSFYDVGNSACESAGLYFDECEYLTPGFDDLATRDQASCLCYTSFTEFAPAAFDDPVSSCLDFLRANGRKAADDLVNSLQLVDGVCSRVGDLLANQTILGLSPSSSNLGSSSSPLSRSASTTQPASRSSNQGLNTPSRPTATAPLASNTASTDISTTASTASANTPAQAATPTGAGAQRWHLDGFKVTLIWTLLVGASVLGFLL